MDEDINAAPYPQDHEDYRYRRLVCGGGAQLFRGQVSQEHGYHIIPSIRSTRRFWARSATQTCAQFPKVDAVDCFRKSENPSACGRCHAIGATVLWMQSA
jgi:hypothetical protein